jgi:hypothetical protein
VMSVSFSGGVLRLERRSRQDVTTVAAVSVDVESLISRLVVVSTLSLYHSKRIRTVSGQGYKT